MEWKGNKWTTEKGVRILLDGARPVAVNPVTGERVECEDVSAVTREAARMATANGDMEYRYFHEGRLTVVAPASWGLQ